MKYRVRLTLNAEEDIDSALHWFSENQAGAAGDRWFAQLVSKIDTLASMPTRCSVAAESDELGIELRELLSASAMAFTESSS